MSLFEFAFCYNFDQKISQLAVLCPEKWSFGAGQDNSILKNYILHTFLKIEGEKKIYIDDNNNYALFNTGLYTALYEAIYGYFVPNTIPNKQFWFFDNFYTSYQLGMMNVASYPLRANYFSTPEDLIFNTNYEIVPQVEHIFGSRDNLLRMPASIRNSPSRNILFDGAVKRAKHMIDANYKTAVPQYYKGKIQLLIPMCLVNENKPDLALVVSKAVAGNHYLGHTCLSLDMAYNNARLIARPDSAWLTP